MTMTEQTKKTTMPKKLAASPEQGPEKAPTGKIQHTFNLAAAVFRHHMEKIGGKGEDGMADQSADYVYGLMVGFKPRDFVEEMLVSQMVLTYGRMAYLTAYADQQTNIKWATMMHEATDRAANTFRRQMLALAEYRRPPRANGFTAIGQANIAQQQVVQNRISENEKPTNEQGSMGRDEATKMLPPDAGGIAVSPGVRAACTAMAGQHGTDDAGREGAGERQRPEAR